MSEKLFTRRGFLTAITATAAALPGIVTMAATSPPVDKPPASPKRIGIALGAGGAKGLAHIPMLEALDEMGLRPRLIAGSSMGAVVGSLYASGMRGKDIRQFIGKLVLSDGDTWPEALFRKDLLKWIDFVAPELGSGGLIDGEHFIRYLHTAIHGSRFEELEIPLKVVAADFWKRKQVVLDSGDLLPAIEASMAFPGLFTPVSMNGHILVDGGTVNPVPFDLLFDDCDITIAIDVMGSTSVNDQTPPTFFDAIFGSTHIMHQAIIAEKMKIRSPDIYIKPAITDVRMLEFMSAEQVYRQAEPAKAELKKALNTILC